MKIYLFIFLCISIYSNVFSQNIDKLQSKAIESHINQDYKAGIKWYTKVLEKDSMYYNARLNRGFCYSQVNKLQESISDFEFIIKVSPNDTLVLIHLASAYGVNREFKKAINYYQKALTNNAKLNYLDYFNLGSDYYYSGINDSAKLYLEKSFNLDSINSPAVQNLAWVYLDENPEKSCFYFNESYLKDTLNSKNINNLGYSHLLCGSLEKAFELFKKAEKIDPENSFIFRNLGLYYMKMNQRELACMNLKKAIDLHIITEWGENYIDELSKYCNNQN